MANSTDLSGMRSLPCRYLAASLAAVTALVVQPSRPVLPYNPLSPYSLGIVFGWYGDLPTGLLPLVPSFLLFDCVFIGPLFCLWLPKQVGLVRLLTLAVICPFFIMWSELQARIGNALPAKSEPRLGGMELCKI